MSLPLYARSGWHVCGVRCTAAVGRVTRIGPGSLPRSAAGPSRVSGLRLALPEDQLHGVEDRAGGLAVSGVGLRRGQVLVGAGLPGRVAEVLGALRHRVLSSVGTVCFKHTPWRRREWNGERPGPPGPERSTVR